MRDRMEAHRRNPACAGCHKLMDPIGLALENFDGIGKWRSTDNGARIDAASQLADGTNVNGPAALRKAMLQRPEHVRAQHDRDALHLCARPRRRPTPTCPTCGRIMKDAARTNYRFSSLVLGIAKSLPFQQRRSES